MNYRIIEETVDGIGPWYWINNPGDMTFTFIKRDWENYHGNVIRSLYPNGGKTVIQAGGNCGMYPRLLSEHFQRVYTFEPSPRLFPFVAMNCGGRNVIPMNAGLAEVSGHFIEINDFVPDNCGMTTVHPYNGNNIPVFQIDSFNFNEVDLIFLDTEGCELPILMGAMDTLARCSPKLILEIHPALVGNVSHFLKSVGYELKSHIGPHDYFFDKE